MHHDYYATTAITSDRTKVPIPTINALVRAGRITPAIRGAGRGRSHLFTRAQVFAFSVAQLGRAKFGLCDELCWSLLEWLGDFGEDDWEREFAAGRNTLVFLPGEGALMEIVTEDTVRDPNSDVVRDAVADGVYPLGLNLEKFWRAHERADGNNRPTTAMKH